MLSDKEIQYLKNIRQHLHRYPELSGKEEKTSKFLWEEINKSGDFKIQQIGGTGILVSIQKGEGPVVFFRGDMDALPIEEINDFEYRSVIPGVSHKCGHDGHSTVMLGLLRAVSEKFPGKGTIHILFQPAEENGGGAKAVMDESHKIEPTPDWVFAFHNLPAYALNEIVTKEGAFTMAANSIIIKLKGKTSHAAEPELGLNPASVMAAIISEYDHMNIPDPKKDEFQILTPVFGSFGEKAYGVSAGYGELHYTLRSRSNEVMERMEKECVRIAETEAGKRGLKTEISFTEKFFANNNHRAAVSYINKVADNLELKKTARDHPFKWGEDFGLFTEKYKGAMFGIGAGENSPALHNPDYDFPDEIIPTAVALFYGIAEEILND